MYDKNGRISKQNHLLRFAVFANFYATTATFNLYSNYAMIVISKKNIKEFSIFKLPQKSFDPFPNGADSF